ncbi:methyltransferase domain-containing protein [Nonomuraea sp. NPDC050227]|uniref:methyltransferase domain-containing protein n=1 Tax=Nonomuraea sp. NPDC050227 TaxID=3364360 RepID=UPI0037A1E93C
MVVDAGCGSGPLFSALRDRGAIVTGIDASAGMLELARRRLGDDADQLVLSAACADGLSLRKPLVPGLLR